MRAAPTVQLRSRRDPSSFSLQRPTVLGALRSLPALLALATSRDFPFPAVA
ncbi:MAG TPA: hypothetical protein VNN74_01845 [Candidatus Micrarchaeia archaeon]|nr:hypothetical protein [Candidatus Micrarchaeia archaeon]